MAEVWTEEFFMSTPAVRKHRDGKGDDILMMVAKLKQEVDHVDITLAKQKKNVKLVKEALEQVLSGNGKR